MSDLTKAQLESKLKSLEDLIHNHNSQIEIWTSHWDNAPVLSVYLSRDEKRIIIDAGYDTDDDFIEDREEKRKKMIDILSEGSARNTPEQFADKLLELLEQPKKEE